ncbi:MAG TPA: septum site-determining protein MinC [Bauldia sp.]|nr:septum site-determining protein MinC [Bauldia sp.]
MSLALAKSRRPKLRLAGRSFLAFVLEPFAPVSEWLADLDDVARQSFAFFANRPVVLDLSALRPSKSEAEALLAALKARAIRVIAVEGVDPDLLGPALAPLAAGMASAKIIEFPGAESRQTAESPKPPPSATAPASMVIDKPVRSGQSIYFPDGDLTVIGSVSSGAEIIAGGSIHVYGALRGRAVAGATGDGNARVVCRRYHAELVAIDGNYMAAEESPQKLIGKPVHIRLQGGSLLTQVLE